MSRGAVKGRKMMDSKRHDDLDDELDIQALLDKYLPEDQSDGEPVSEREELSDISFEDALSDITDQDADVLDAEDSKEIAEEFDDEGAAEDVSLSDDAPDLGSGDLYMSRDEAEPSSEDDLSFYDDFVISGGDSDEEQSAESYDAYSEYSDSVDDGTLDLDEVLGWDNADAVEAGESGDAKPAAGTVLDLGDDELVIDEDIIAQLMASDDAQFGGIEGFDDIETLSGFDVSAAQNDVNDEPQKNNSPADNAPTVEFSRDFTEEKASDDDRDEYEDFVGATIDELASEDHGETDMDFIVAFGLEDELGRHVGAKKASRLKKNYDKVVERREEIERKTVHNEYRDASQTAELTTLYKKAYSSSKIKIILTAVFSLILLFYENLPLLGYQLASFLDPAVYPVVYIMVDLQIALLAVAVVYEQVFYGFARLFKGKPSPESILSVTALISIIYSIVAANSATPPAEPTLFNFPVAFCAFMTAVYSYLTVKREIFSFNVISSKKPKFALRRLPSSEAVMEAAAFGEGGEDIGDVLKIEKVSFVDGYFYRTESANSSNSAVVFMCLGLSLILSLLFAIYSAMMDNSASASFMMGYAAFVTAVPMSILFSHSYPFYKANSNSYDVNSTIVGENSLEEYSGASVITFDDKLVFPSVGVKVQNIKVYNNYRFDRVLYYAASVFTKTGGPLSDVFEIATVETGYSEDVLLTGIGDGYLQTEVDGKSIMFGRAEDLRDQGIEIPEEITYEDDGSDDVSVMYMIFKGKLVAKMNILYSLDSDFEYVVKQLAGSGMSVCVKTLDPNIDESMIKSRVKLDKYPMRVIRYSSLEEIATVVERSDSGIVARGSSKGLLETVTYCDKVLESKRTNSFVSLIQAIISIVVLAVILLSGNFSSVRSLLSVLLQLFWLIPMGIVTKALLK